MSSKNCRPTSQHRSRTGTGGKPSTWFPPGGLVELTERGSGNPKKNIKILNNMGGAVPLIGVTVRMTTIVLCKIFSEIHRKDMDNLN